MIRPTIILISAMYLSPPFLYPNIHNKKRNMIIRPLGADLLRSRQFRLPFSNVPEHHPKSVFLL
jgi:hypothetical protein